MMLLQIFTDSVFNEPEINNITPFLVVRLAINLITAFILIRFIYYPAYKTKQNFFLFFIFNLLIFAIIYMMARVELSIGSAFGLFAVFSIIRYRTENLSAKDTTYMFMLIAIGFINAVSMPQWIVLAIINSAFLLATYLLESRLIVKPEATKVIVIKNLKLLAPEKKGELLLDLQRQVGAKINFIDIEKIDHEKGSATIRITYFTNKVEKHIKIDQSIEEFKEELSQGIKYDNPKDEKKIVDKIDDKINEARNEIWHGNKDLSQTQVQEILNRKVLEFSEEQSKPNGSIKKHKKHKKNK